MLDVFTGPFHPSLESALIQQIRLCRASNSFEPLAIIVPSEPLRARLKWILCYERQLALLNVSFLTFSQLARRILEDEGLCIDQPIRTPFFFKEILRHCLQSHVQETPEWTDVAEIPGAWAALLSTIQDLQGARVEEQSALDVIDQLDQLSASTLIPLIRLYGFLQRTKSRLESWDHEDLTIQALPFVAHAPFLSRLDRIIYYGFYDLNQVQLDFFQAIARTYPCTLYYPLIRHHSAFEFAQQFFDRHIFGLAGQSVTWLQEEQNRVPLYALFEDASLAQRSFLDEEQPQEAPVSPGFCVNDKLVSSIEALEGHDCLEKPACHIIQVSGMDDEITMVAKDILGWVEERNAAFHDIGVVGRTLSGYETTIPRIFAQHNIPFASTMTRALGSFPLARTAIQLLKLRLEDFPRAHVMDFFMSPYTRLSSLCPDLPNPRSDLWNMISRQLGITRGITEWGRLECYEPSEWRNREAERLYEETFLKQQSQGLWQAVKMLWHELQQFPQQGSYSRFVINTKELWHRFIKDVVPNEADLTLACWEALLAVMDELDALDPLTDCITFGDFVSVLHRFLEEQVVSVYPSLEESVGVRVMDAMEARGISFRILYIIGMTEKVFPRHIQEDAFLRDPLRRQLEGTLGYKVPEKLAGYDEEKLLFYLLANSVTESVTVIHQRADKTGRPCPPSSYIGEIKNCLGPVPEHIVSKSFTQKMKQHPHFSIARLIPTEYARYRLLARCIPNRTIQSWLPMWKLFEQGLSAFHAKESLQRGLGVFDGMIGFHKDRWEAFKYQGLSPTTLEPYATCPFQYFSSQVLGLTPLSCPEALREVETRSLGILAHAILREALEVLKSQGMVPSSYPCIDDSQAVLRQVLDDVAGPIFEAFAKTHAVGHALIWQLQQKNLLDVLQQVLTVDYEEMGTVWEPYLFEEDVTGTLVIALPTGIETFSLNGRIDRVDWSSSQHAYRLIDYKYIASKQRRPFENNLLLGAVRGRKLQPPLYLIMAPQTIPHRLGQSGIRQTSVDPPACQGVWFYTIAPNWRQQEGPLCRTEFPGHAWSSLLRKPLEQALSLVLSGIREGQFFISPGGHCDWCHYRSMCHVSHQPSLWRMRNDRVRVMPHRTLSRAVLPKE